MALSVPTHVAPCVAQERFDVPLELPQVLLEDCRDVLDFSRGVVVHPFSGYELL